MMKKIAWAGLIGLFIVFLSACSTKTSSGESNKIIIDSQGSDAQVWNFIAKSKAAKKAGVVIKVNPINDGRRYNNTTNKIGGTLKCDSSVKL
ncbi:hypothetical protein [Heyndrickxia acidicola]|uniref:Uncharacterized protein n=1 Tax=Heyndrickxia acidicola TaxID=209389 RepID=A0ABU6MBD0_9BACI|nr:hypothetical protein [Heyndrickxia acidicola]MED1201729.1 hypothetical protein [Heyndrickxia acidicola]